MNRAFSVENALKKYFKPSRFEVQVFVLGDREFKQFSSEFEVGRTLNATAGLSKQFTALETMAYSAIKIVPSAHVAIALDDGYTEVGQRVQSHLSSHCVILDANRSSPRWNLTFPVPFVSELVMPYLGLTGATSEQIERGARTSLRCAVDGWRKWSLDHDGIAKRL